MERNSLSNKMQKAIKMLEDFTGTTAALAPYPVLPVSTVTVTKPKKNKKDNEKEQKLNYKPI